MKNFRRRIGTPRRLKITKNCSPNRRIIRAGNSSRTRWPRFSKKSPAPTPRRTTHIISAWPSSSTPTRIWIIPITRRILAEVIARAQAAGITKIISIGTSLESSERAIRLAEKYPAVYAAVGWHPTEALNAPDDLRPALRELARHPKVVAIGETGLDYHHLPSEKPEGELTRACQRPALELSRKTHATRKSRRRFSGSKWKSPLNSA